jgi:hypothetical protein
MKFKTLDDYFMTEKYQLPHIAKLYFRHYQINSLIPRKKYYKQMKVNDYVL